MVDLVESVVDDAEKHPIDIQPDGGAEKLSTAKLRKHTMRKLKIIAANHGISMVHLAAMLADKVEKETGVDVIHQCSNTIGPAQPGMRRKGQ